MVQILEMSSLIIIATQQPQNVSSSRNPPDDPTQEILKCRLSLSASNLQIIEPQCPICLQGTTGKLIKQDSCGKESLKFLHTSLIQGLKEEWV